jgi:multidrug efflux pump subunit AcrA (membrane-fusion protein)
MTRKLNWKLLKTYPRRIWKTSTRFIDKHPLPAFFGFLGVLFLLVLVGTFLRKPADTTAPVTPPAKLVEVYTLGDSPKMTFSAKVEKSGVISIFAQSPGVVSKVRVTEGDRVRRGQSLLSLSSNYQGANAASLSRQMAEKNFQATSDNFELQKSIIANQRELAEKGNLQAEQMREISRRTLDDTRSQIDLNEDIVDYIQAQITTLEQTNVNGSNAAALQTARQGKAGALAGLNQLRSALRTLEYQSADDKVPADIANLSKDLTLKQLDLQEKGLTLGKEIAELNLKLARVSESLMYPATPCAGVVERVYLKPGQTVAPGTLLATIKADEGENTAVVLVTKDLASQVAKTEASEFLIGGKSVPLVPRYVSTEATDGNLYSILYAIPKEYSADLVNSSNLEVHIPMGAKRVITDTFIVPLDSVYQTQKTAFVYVTNQDGETLKAKTVEVGLGEITGQYVQITQGLTNSDTVIVSRNIAEGDSIRTQ